MHDVIACTRCIWQWVSWMATFEAQILFCQSIVTRFMLRFLWYSRQTLFKLVARATFWTQTSSLTIFTHVESALFVMIASAVSIRVKIWKNVSGSRFIELRQKVPHGRQKPLHPCCCSSKHHKIEFWHCYVIGMRLAQSSCAREVVCWSADVTSGFAFVAETISNILR